MKIIFFEDMWKEKFHEFLAQLLQVAMHDDLHKDIATTRISLPKTQLISD